LTYTPIETISEMLGHESIDMTRKYLGIKLDDQEDPMKALDRSFNRLCNLPHNRGKK